MSPEKPAQPVASTSRRVFLAGSAVTLGAGVSAGPTAALAGERHRGPHVGGGSSSWPDGPGRRNRRQPPDPELRRMLAEIDPRRVERTIRRLVSFGTRHTLSVQDDPDRGIGAARDWIFDTLSSYAVHSGGHMTVEKQSFVQPVSDRVPTPTRITNVLATLRGSRFPERVYVISGHYDSRVTDVMDATSYAPGADDDARDA